MAEKGYDRYAKLLHDYGVRYVFLQDAIFRKGMKEAEAYGIKQVLTHSEGAAGCMADGYARASGGPGVCMAQSIGTANLSGGLMDAWLATSPVVAITGRKLPEYQYKNAYQEAPHHNFFQDITKFNCEVTDTSEQFDFLMRQCFKEATSGKPRPVHIDVIGRDAVETEYCDMKHEALPSQPEYAHYPPYRPLADPTLVKKAAEWINEAERPMIIGGRGAFNSGAGEVLLRLAQKADIPVATTPDGKTLVDEYDPMWIGTTGVYGMNSANQAARRADLVILIGTATSDNVTCDWTCPPPSMKVVQIDICPEELGRCYPNSVGLCGDARAVLEQLLPEIKEASHAPWRAETAELLAKTLAKYAESYPVDHAPIHTAQLCREIEKAISDDTAVVVDTGYTTVWASTNMRLKNTQKFYRATGSLGWSFPGSIGVKLGDPDRPVLCLTGDGGFFYHLSEMETLVRYGINTVTVIDNNGRLNACTPQLKFVYGEDNVEALKNISFAPVPFAEIAEKIGLYAEKVEKVEDIGPAIKRAFASGRPALVEVITAPTPHLPAVWDE